MQIEVYITIRAFSNYERLRVENNSEVLTKVGAAGTNVSTGGRGLHDAAVWGAAEFRNHPDKLAGVFIPLCVQLQRFSNAVRLAVQIFGVLEM